LFEEMTDQKKNWLTGSESDKERELEDLLKDLANYKVQVEAKDAAYMEALLNLEHFQKTAEGLSTLVRNTEIERDKYMNDYVDAATQVDELKFKMEMMASPLLEAIKIGEQLQHALHELEVTKEELLKMETELAAARDSETKAWTQAELMEMVAKTEKEKVEELLKHVSELNDAIMTSKVAANEAEKERLSIISEKDAEIEVAKMAVVQAQEELKDLRKEVEAVEELTCQLLAKSLLIEALQAELKQTGEKICLSEKAASDAAINLKKLQDELHFKERKSSSQEVLIEAFKMEQNHLKLELKSANELTSQLTGDVEMLTDDIQKAKAEIDEIREKEAEAQVEIAMLKSEIHKERSKIVAAETAEARAENVKSGLYLAVQQLAVEAGTAKKENERLKEGAEKVDEENDTSGYFSPHLENPSDEVDASQIDESKTETEEGKDDDDTHVAISLKEYESLIKKAEKVDQISVSKIEDSDQLAASDQEKHEMEILKKELKSANAKIAEFRNRTEQAVSRAEMAEKAKAGLEDQLRKRKEHQQKRKAALAALREVSAPREYESTPTNSISPNTHPPLGKVLNMKF
jgi:hypothetical protein